jgi:hypothetical protein
MPAFAPGATFLGESVPLAANATDTPIVPIPPGYGWLFIYFYIAGYSNSGVAIMRFGTTPTAVDTGTTYSVFTSHWIVAATVQASNSRVSQTGIWVANDAVTTGRRGQMSVYNPNAAPKNVVVDTVTFGAQNPTAAATAMTTQSRSVGSWFNNAQIQSVRMNGGTGVNLTTGSFITVYGIPGVD